LRDGQGISRDVRFGDAKLAICWAGNCSPRTFFRASLAAPGQQQKAPEMPERAEPQCSKIRLLRLRCQDQVFECRASGNLRRYRGARPRLQVPSVPLELSGYWIISHHPTCLCQD
jgi:hypothetical protein